MDCSAAASKVSCELGNVVEALGHPTGWEIAGVAISGLAAAGTLWIAFLNLRILKRQEETEVANSLKQERAARLRWTGDVLEAVTETLMEDEKRKLLSPAEFAADEYARVRKKFSLLREAEQHQFPQGTKLLNWCLNHADSDDDNALTLIVLTQQDWADDPNTPLSELIDRHSGPPRGQHDGPEAQG